MVGAVKPCQSCQKHAATVHILEPSYGDDGSVELRKLNLCPPCAKSAGVPMDPAVPGFPQIVSMLGKVLLKAKKGSAGEGLSCPECGWTLRDFRQTSRFGCPKDYEIFESFVDELLERVHGATEHSGSQAEANLARLRRELEEAVAEEDYEKAAGLRDSIKDLEVSLEKMEEAD